MKTNISCFILLLSVIEFALAAPRPVDMIIEGDYLLTMNEANEVLEDAAIAIQDGEIVAVDQQNVIRASFTARQVLSGEGRILMPGLVNAHSHMAMTLLRGLADDLALMTWLNDFIFPAEVGFVDRGFVRTGTELACWEMLLGGTTTVVDMYYFPEDVASVLEQCGMRGIVAATVIGQPSPDAETPQLGLSQARTFIQNWRERSDRVVPALGPHAIYTTPPDVLMSVKAAALELEVPVSMHIAESESEIRFAKDQYKLSTIQLLADIGFLDQRMDLIGAHVVWPDADEIELLAHFGVGAINNPTSNMKVTAGVAPVAALQAGGVNVGLGTDGAASNNDLDMWEEMRMATLLQKITRSDPTALPAGQVLRMATIDGAKAIGLDDKIGSLQVGKRADVIQVRIDSPHMQPLYDVTSHLVYVADSQDVAAVVVDGVLVVKSGKLLTLDTEALQRKVSGYRDNIRRAILESTGE